MTLHKYYLIYLKFVYGVIMSFNMKKVESVIRTNVCLFLHVFHLTTPLPWQQNMMHIDAQNIKSIFRNYL
jgi:hypothetical protein